MSEQRDLGTAILNIKIAFEKLNKAAIKKQIEGVGDVLEKAAKKAAVSKDSETIGKELVQGIEKGIESSKSKVEAQAVGLWGSFKKSFKKAAGISSPSKETLKLARNIAEGLINGLRNGQSDVAQAAGQLSIAATPQIATKFLDQITNLTDNLTTLKAAWRATRAAMEGDEPTAAIGDLQKIEKAIRNAVIALETLKEKSKSSPNLEIDQSPKERVRDLEKESIAQKKAQAELQKSAGGARRLSQDLRELVTTYKTAGQGAAQLGTLTAGAFDKAEKTFSKVINTAKKFKNFDDAERTLLSMKQSLTASSKSIEDQNLRKRVLEGINQSYTKQLQILRDLRQVEEAKPQQMRDKAAKEIERQSTAIRKTRQALKDLSAQYEITGKSAGNLAGTSGAISERLTAFFSKIVTGATKTKDFAQSLTATTDAERELGQQIRRSITDVDLQANALSILAEESNKARAALISQEAAYKRTQDSKRLNQDVKKTLAGTGTADLASLGASLVTLNKLKTEMQRLGVATDVVDVAIARLNNKIKNIEAGKIENASKKISASGSKFSKTLEKIRELGPAFKDAGGNAKTFAATVGSLRNVVNTSFTAVSRKANATKDYRLALSEARSQQIKMSEAIKSSVADAKLQQSMLIVVAKEYSNLTGKILAARRAESQKGERKAISEKISDITAKASSADEAGLRRAVEQMKNVIETSDALGHSSARARRELDRLNNRLKKSEMDTYRRKVENVTRTLRNFTSGINQTGEQIRRVSFILRDIGRQMMTIARTMFRYMMPVVQDFMAFEQAVTDVLAVTGDLNSGLNKTDIVATELGQTILGLAGEFVFSAEEIAGVAKQLALAGFNTEQIIKSLKSVITLAAATGSDLATAGNIITTSMAVFALEADQTSRVADVFAATVTRANTNLNQLSEAFKIAAPVAAGMGQSIEQTAAALGVLANAGLRGSIAGTGFSRILTQITEKADKLQSILEPLGSSFDAINPEKRTIDQIVKEFARLNLSTAALRGIFDLRAFRSFNAILAQGAGKVGAFADQLDRAARVSQAISSARLNTLAGEVQLLSDSFKALKISIGDVIGTEARNIVGFFKELTISIKDFFSQNKEALKPFVKFAVVAAGVIGTLGTSLFTLGSASAFLAAPLISLGAVLASVTSVATFLTGILFTFGVVLGKAAAIAAGVTAAIAAVFAGFAAVVGSFLVSLSVSITLFSDQWSEAFIKMGHILRDMYERVFIPIYNGFTKNIDAIEKATARFLSAITTAAGGMVGSLSADSWDSFGFALAAIVAGVIDLAATITEDLTPTLKTLVALIDRIISQSDKIVWFFNLISGIMWELAKFRLWIATANFTWPNQIATLLFPQQMKEFWEFLLPTLAEVEKSNGELAKSFDAQADSIAKVLVKSSDYARELGKVSQVIKNIASVKPVEFEELVDLADKGFLSTDKRNEITLEIKAEIENLDKLEDEFRKLASDTELSFEDKKAREDLHKRMAELVEYQKVIDDVGSQLDYIANLTKGTVEENVKTIKELAEIEQKKSERINKLVDEITEMAKVQSFGGNANIDAAKKIAEELADLGIDLNINFVGIKSAREEIARLEQAGLEIPTALAKESKKNFVEPLVAALNGALKELDVDTSTKLGQLGDILTILPEISGKDLRTKDGLRAVAEALAKQSEIQDDIAKNFDAARKASDDLWKDIDKFGKSAHELRMLEIEEERKARLSILEEEARLLNLRIDRINTELRQQRALGGDTEALEKELTELMGRLQGTVFIQGIVDEQEIVKFGEALKGISGDLRKDLDKFGKSAHDLRMLEIEEERKARWEILEEEAGLINARIVKIENAIIEHRQAIAKRRAANEVIPPGEEDTTKLENEVKKLTGQLESVLANQVRVGRQATKKVGEVIEKDKEARMKAEEDILQTRLEFEDDIQERITIRQLLAERKRAKDLAAKIKELEENVSLKENAAELARLKKELSEASEQALAAEKLKIAEDEQKEVNQDINKVVDKRLDLEFEVVTQLSKQVQSLRDMVMLVKFLDVLQRRKDRQALDSVKNLAREERKLDELRVRAARKFGGQAALKAIAGQEGKVGMLRGIVARNRQQIGAAKVENVDNLFNIEAFLATVTASLTTFVDNLKNNPIIITATFDAESLRKQLTDALEGVNLNNMFGGVPGFGVNFEGGRLAGINTGTINHNDNRVINMNVAKLDPEAARKMGILLNG